MSLTIQDLTKRSMELLTLLEAQEEPSAEDFSVFDRSYRNKFAELTVMDRTYWPIEEIPEEVFEPIAQIMAGVNAVAFGKQAPTVMDDNGQAVSIGVAGLRGLLRVIQRQGSGLPATALFY